MKHFITKSDARHYVMRELRGLATNHAETILWLRGGRFIPFRDEALIEDFLRDCCQRQDIKEALKWLAYDAHQMCKLLGFITSAAMSSLMCNNAA